MTSARPPLRRIAIVGDGQVGLLAACALRRACPTAEVMVAPGPIDAPGFAERAPSSLPSLARFHRRIGLDEAGMIARAGASHRLAIRLEGWGGEDAKTVGYGALEAATAGLQGWRAIGAAADTEPASLSAALAEAGCFMPPSDDRGSRASGIDYALRFDPAAHRARLASLARHLGILTADSDANAADADLIVDTVREPATPWIDWTRYLIADHIGLGDAPPMLSPLDRMVAEPDAIVLISPGRDRTHVTRIGDRRGVPLRSGRATEPWIGNRVRIGDAAATLPPIGWTNLHLATIAMDLLIELLPGRDIADRERAEYNRRWTVAADCVLDFVAAHLAIAARGDTPFWRRIAAAPRPPGLAHRLEEHRRRGRLPHHEEDSIPRELWVQLLARRSGAPGPVSAETYADWFARTGGDAS